MELNPQEQKMGMRWLGGVGLIAILFSWFLTRVDYKLSNSDMEKRLKDNLYELRVAQTSLDSRVTDTRATTPFLVQEKENITAHSKHGE